MRRLHAQELASHLSKLHFCKGCPLARLSLSELRHHSFSLYGWPLQENDWLHWFVFFHLPNWLSLIHANFDCFFKLTFEMINQDQSFGNFIMCCQSFSPDNMKYFFVFSSKILHISFINTKYQLSLKNLTFSSFFLPSGGEIFLDNWQFAVGVKVFKLLIL